MRKISALVLAVLLLVSVLPMGLLGSAETPTSIDGTFESATVGTKPDGWTLLSMINRSGLAMVGNNVQIGNNIANFFTVVEPVTTHNSVRYT